MLYNESFHEYYLIFKTFSTRRNKTINLSESISSVSNKTVINFNVTKKSDLKKKLENSNLEDFKFQMAFAFYSEKYGDHVNAQENTVKINFKEI